MKPICLLFFLLLALFGAEAKQVCYDNVGCFSDDPPWDYGPLPEDPKGREPIYFLLQKGKPAREVKTVDELQMDNMIITSHGFGGNYSSTLFWNQQIIDGIFEVRPTADILFVDWEVLARLGKGKLIYHKPASNCRTIAAVLAKWLSASPKFDSTKVHCIGFSLFAQVCGLTAKRLGTKFGWISAVDPPFIAFRDDDPVTRVDKSDALYVEVMHVSWLAVKRRCGHKDFYVNDGNFQPGCPRNERLLAAMKTPYADFDIWDFLQMFACSHYRAIYLYGLSIIPRDDCTIPFCKCPSKVHFQKGYCRNCPKENMALLGYRSIESNATDGEFYGTTTDREPYCEQTSS